MAGSDLPETIPVFPLPGALLLPRARLPLHIFEPRYLAMVEDVLKTPDRLIGMVQPYDGADGERLHSIGCAGRLVAFSETDDRRYMVSLLGKSRFRITHEQEGFAPYRRCNVSWTGFERDLGREEQDEGLDRSALLALLRRYFGGDAAHVDWEAFDEATDEMLVNALAMLSPLEPEDKQALLEAPSLTTRRETLVTLIEFALHSGDKEDPMQ